MTEELERTMRMNYLYDFYNSLLTDKQRRYIELYYLEDFAFSEIAEELDVTRQAVYDNLKRSKDLLEHYEENLSMYRNFKSRQEFIKRLKNKLGKSMDSETEEIINRLEELD
ncbi:putative DNA-binding protein [Salinicoccus sp. HZC-1]|uniref:putative DNA-binding protein n=1 Tax=Salinicoccus sp. HZC-1 TaxID=3385497 RepID=UPI00398B7918